MDLVCSVSGRACLCDWNRPLAVEDILALLLELKRVHANARCSVVLILVVREHVAPLANHVLSSLQATLPAILDCCQNLVIALEGTTSERTPLRIVFQNHRFGMARNDLPVFNTLSEAFAHAQRAAPHDVLELQRHVLRQSSPPSGRWA
jgi:hypothetical protein